MDFSGSSGNKPGRTMAAIVRESRRNWGPVSPARGSSICFAVRRCGHLWRRHRQRGNDAARDTMSGIASLACNPFCGHGWPWCRVRQKSPGLLQHYAGTAACGVCDSPVNSAHAFCSSRLTWLIRPSLSLNLRAASPVRLPRARNCGDPAVATRQAAEPGGEVELRGDHLIGTNVPIFDDDFLPTVFFGVVLVQSLDHDLPSCLAIRTRDVVAVQRAAEHAAIPGLGDGESRLTRWHSTGRACSTRPAGRRRRRRCTETFCTASARSSASRCRNAIWAWASIVGAIFEKTSCQAGVAGFG